MTISENAPGYIPNPDYSQDHWKEASDDPELTYSEIAELRLNGVGLPAALADAFRHLVGRPKSKVQAVPMLLRMTPDVRTVYIAERPNWQSRINEEFDADFQQRR